MKIQQVDGRLRGVWEEWMRLEWKQMESPPFLERPRLWTSWSFVSDLTGHNLVRRDREVDCFFGELDFARLL